MPPLAERVAAIEARLTAMAAVVAELKDRHEDTRRRVYQLERARDDETAVARAAGKAAARRTRRERHAYALAGIALTVLNVVVARGWIG